MFLLTCLITSISSSWTVEDQSLELVMIQDVKEAHAYFDNELKYKANVVGIKDALCRKEKINIVDVWDKDAYKVGHIPGAVNIPYAEWGKINEDTAESYGLQKNVINYIYCYTWDCNLALKAALKKML